MRSRGNFVVIRGLPSVILSSVHDPGQKKNVARDTEQTPRETQLSFEVFETCEYCSLQCCFHGIKTLRTQVHSHMLKGGNKHVVPTISHISPSHELKRSQPRSLLLLLFLWETLLNSLSGLIRGRPVAFLRRREIFPSIPWERKSSG